MVQYIIMIYYWINEKFTIHGKGIELDSDCKIAKRLRRGNGKYNTVYGNNVIDINDSSIKCYQWTFEIIAITCYPFVAIAIGIDASGNKYHSNDFADRYINKNYFYSVASNQKDI